MPVSKTRVFKAGIDFLLIKIYVVTFPDGFDGRNTAKASILRQQQIFTGS